MSLVGYNLEKTPLEAIGFQEPSCLEEFEGRSTCLGA